MGELRSLADVAAELGVTERWLRDLINRRGIPVLRNGRHGRIIRFDDLAIAALTEAMRTPCPSKSPPARTPGRSRSRGASISPTGHSSEYEEALRATSAPPKPPETAQPGSRVYFIALNETVKIGVTTDPEKRVATLQIGSPGKLRLIGSMAGGVVLERRLHQRFSRYHVRGEWFSITGRLEKFLRDRFPDG